MAPPSESSGGGGARPWPRSRSGASSAIAAWVGSGSCGKSRLTAFADFVCEAAKVIVELDGAAHDGREDYDERRTQTLERLCRSEISRRTGSCRSGRNGGRHTGGASFGEAVTSHPPTAARRAPPSLYERGKHTSAGPPGPIADLTPELSLEHCYSAFR